MYHEGEWFDLPTFYQRLCDLPRLEPPVPNDINENHNECSPNQASGDSSTNPDDDLSGLEVSVENKNNNVNHNEFSTTQSSEDSSTKPDDDLSGLEVSVENKNINENYNEFSTTQSSDDSSTNPDDDLSGFEVSVENENNENYNECSPKQASEDSSTNPDDDLSGFEVSIENKNINENYNECSTTQSSDDSSTNPDDDLSGLEVSVENENINKNYNECSPKQSSEDYSTKPDDDGCGDDDDEEYDNEDYDDEDYDEEDDDVDDDDEDYGEDYEDGEDDDEDYDDGEDDDEENSKGGNNQNQHHTTCDNFVKDSMETLTSRDPQKTESGDTDKNTFSILVQKPLCGNDNVGKFETFMHEDVVESRIVYDSSLGLKSEDTIEDSFFGSDLTTENLGYNLDSIDSSYQSSFLEVNKEGKSGIDYDPLLGLKSEAFIEDAFFGSNLTTETLGCYSESIDSSLQSSFPEAIKEGISRIADDSSLMQKTEAHVGKTLFGNDSFTKNPEKVREAITDDKSRIHNDPSFGLKRKVSCKETLKYRTTKYPESVQNDIKEHKSRIDNDPSLESKTDVPIEEKILDCDENTENLEKIQKSIPEGSSFKEDNSMNPPLAKTDEYTYYYSTRSTTMMEVIQVCRSLDEVDPILRCRIGFTCNFCGDQFSSREKLREHVKTRMYGYYVPSGAYICSRYSRRYCIVLGYNSSGRVQYKCSHCLKRFKRFGNYARHCNNEKICKRYQSYLVSPLVQPCLLDDEEGFECLFCHESSKDYADLRFHECVMRRDPPEKCYEDLPADEDADDYIDDDDGVDDDSVEGDDDVDGGVDDDSTDESIKCDLCGVEFHGSQIYAEHRREHDSGEKYECKVCYQSFKRLCSFKTHMAVNHKVKTREKKERSAKRKP